jgi:hypothetical protein
MARGSIPAEMAGIHSRRLQFASVSRPNDLAFVRDVMARLDEGDVRTWLFGGWAEELLGLIGPRRHHDVDLLYLASDFTSADAFIACNDDLSEITRKRFAHKRAFLSDGVMVELFLVRPAGGKLSTLFWGTTSHVWPADLLDQQAGGIRVASAAAVLGYRTAHARLSAG